jgi:hemoglobin
LSLYDQLGQQAGIATAVDEFYVRVLGDPSLAPYFEGTDVDEVRQRQVALMSTVSGGPQQYSGGAMDLSHRRLSITDETFGKVVGHLGATLDDLGVASDVRDQVASVLVAEGEHMVTAPASETKGAAWTSNAYAKVQTRSKVLATRCRCSSTRTCPSSTRRRGRCSPSRYGSSSRLFRALGHILVGVDDLDVLVPYLHQRGSDHRVFGALAAH